MKFPRPFRNRTPKPDATKGPEETLESQPEKQAGKKGGLAGLPGRLLRRKKNLPPPAIDAGGDKDIFDMQKIRERISGLFEKTKSNKKMKIGLFVGGAAAGIAAVTLDVMVAGGIGTVTIASCLYSDFRNGQHIRKISAELAKIDDKISGLRETEGPSPDLTPMLDAISTRIAGFNGAAEKLPEDVRKELDDLKAQVESMRAKNAPANDDAQPPAQKRKP